MVKIKCKRCLHEWEYKGKSVWYCNCPMCKTTNKIQKSSEN